MNKFLVTGETITKDELVSAIEAGKIDAKVEEDRVDCLVMDFRPSDLPNASELTHEKGMEILISVSEQLASAFHDIVNDDTDDEDEAVPEIEDDDDDEE